MVATGPKILLQVQVSTSTSTYFGLLLKAFVRFFRAISPRYRRWQLATLDKQTVKIAGDVLSSSAIASEW